MYTRFGFARLRAPVSDTLRESNQCENPPTEREWERFLPISHHRRRAMRG